FFSRGDIYQENLLLKQKVEDLEAQIQRNQELGIMNQELDNKYLLAKVFSTYPFNVNNTLTLNVGKKHGVKEGVVVTVGKNILLGQIIEVFENKSIVRTVFDPQWQLPVRISQDEIDALLTAGIEPKITLFEKDMPIQVGDAVYSAGSDFPYGLKIGEIIKVKQTNSNLFKEARLKMPYNINDLREVYIVINR
ncbi:MAG: rod shape-determining protein MreC, partial [Candidatus Paceibacterota bacterium]